MRWVCTIEAVTADDVGEGGIRLDPLKDGASCDRRRVLCR